jgi:hypothetical protein
MTKLTGSRPDDDAVMLSAVSNNLSLRPKQRAGRRFVWSVLLGALVCAALADDHDAIINIRWQKLLNEKLASSITPHRAAKLLHIVKLMHMAAL